MIFDTHCHLFDKQFEKDLTEVVERAQEGGVLNMLVLGDNIDTSLKAIKLADEYEGLYAAVGVFPCECYNLNIEDVLNKIEELVLKNKKIVAIGEIGLDYYWEKEESKKETQRMFFVEQLKLANKLNLPVSIHARESIDDVYRLLKENFPKAGAIMHCFSSSVEMMKKFVDLGCYISLGGPVTFKNAKTPKEVAANIPIDRLLIETDSPYLTPHPYRGQRNEPYYTNLILAEIALIKNETISNLEKVVFNNSLKILGVK